MITQRVTKNNFRGSGIPSENLPIVSKDFNDLVDDVLAIETNVETIEDITDVAARTDIGQTFTGVQVITNLTLPTNGQILHTVPTTDGHATGPTTNAFNCGYTSSAVGDLVYLDVNSTWQKADKGTSAATYSGLLGIALQIKASGAALLVALPGSFVYATGFPALTIGSPVYMDDAGAIVVTQPAVVDHAIRVVGWAVHADKIYFFPSPDYIIHV